MLDFNFSGTEVLLGIAMLVLLLFGVGIWGRHFFRQAPGGTVADLGSRTKYRRVDVFRYQPMLLRLGLICSLAFTFLAFNWTQFTAPSSPAQVSMGELEEIDQAPPITQHQPPPPPPPPPPQFEAVPDPGIVDTMTFSSTDIGSQTSVVPQKKGVAPTPPPPPAPPPIKHDAGEIFVVVEDMPIFGDCAGESDKALRKKCSDRAIIEFIGKQVRYPAIARENGVSGTAVIRFVVEKDGSLTDISVVRNPGAGLGEEAQRVVELMRNSELSWQPGKQQGRAVRVQFNLPVRFTLQ